MRVVIFFLFLVILSFNVNALAVASDYLKDKTMQLKDGTSTLYGIRIQNSGSEEASFQLTYDDSIAKVIDYKEIYTIPPSSKESILFNISVPKNLRPGDTFTVSYTIHQLEGGGSGVPILLKIGKNFKVEIIKNPDKFYIDELYVYYPQAIIVLIIISIIAIKIFWKKSKYGKIKVNKKRKIIKWEH